MIQLPEEFAHEANPRLAIQCKLVDAQVKAGDCLDEAANWAEGVLRQELLDNAAKQFARVTELRYWLRRLPESL